MNPEMSLFIIRAWLLFPAAVGIIYVIWPAVRWA